MKIKQVEELVGITRKNIRFYEDQGLLNVERAENGYREYHQADVIRLQEIKLFRKMDISIEEMKLLFEKKKSLQICLEQHLKELDHRKEGLSKMQDMCERLILEHRSLESLNAEDCLEEIEQMEKEGAKFMNVNKTDVHNKKRKGAIIGAAVMTLLMLLTIIIIFWANIQDPIPTGLFLLLGFRKRIIRCTIRKIIHISAHFNAIEQLINNLIIAVYRDALIRIVKIVIVIRIAHREPAPAGP